MACPDRLSQWTKEGLLRNLADSGHDLSKKE